MRIGVPKEIKIHEYRVGLVPAAVRELVESGHEVLVQTGAAAGIGFADADYQRVGAKIAASAEEVFEKADLIVKVKEPQPQECARLRRRPGPLHVPAPRGRQGAGRSAAEVRRDLHRVRDGHGAGRLVAAADPDERSGRPHVRAGRRLLPAESQRRARHPARRRAGRGPGQGRRARRRRRRAPTPSRWPSACAPTSPSSIAP